MTPPDERPPFDEESLLRALRAPGSAGELGEEETYAAMFREARDSAGPVPVPLAHRKRRAVSRLGAGSAFVVALAVGGSAAAAYTNNLPEPIQRFAHRALGPVAPPAPEEQHRHARDRVATVPSPSTSTTAATPSPTPAPSSTPSPTPTHSPGQSPTHSAKPTPTPTATPTPAATPASTPTPTPTPTATLTPTPTPTSTPTVEPPVVPAAVTISGSTHKVEPGQSVAFAGVVTAADGTAVRRMKVRLQTLSGAGWATVTAARTDSSGAVSLVLPPVSTTTRVRLKTVGVHSSRWKVTLHPELTVTSAPGADKGTVVITATALGAQPGDAVQLFTASGQVASGTLDGGSVSFTVTPATTKTRYVVLLPGTSAHGPDHASITVVVKQRDGTTPS